MTAGRPSLPVSVKMARGTYQPCRDASRQTGYTAGPLLAAAEVPADLDERGRAVWARLAAAGHWLTEPDRLALELACKLADLAAIAEARYRASTDPADARALLSMLTTFTAALGRLGFDPSARARLGLAEVEARSKLARMMRSAA